MSAGPRRAWRRVDGIVLLDKPVGASSTGALQRVRRLLQAAKAGHAGTLDPMATGMLPLCFGEATKASGLLLGSAKAYRARLQLGAATDTGDAEGTIVGEAPMPALARDQVVAVLEGLRGPGTQVPPMYSALKHQGRPLYELARRGEVVQREPRAIDIRRLDLVDLAPGRLDFEVVCSKGTYVRVLGEEIATRLGSLGHLTALRRLWVEPFEDDPMVSLEQLEQWAESDSPAYPPGCWLLPAVTAFRRLPRLDLTAGQALHLRQGRVLEAPAGSLPAAQVAAYGPAKAFLGVVSIGPDLSVRTVRLFAADAPDENSGTA